MRTYKLYDAVSASSDNLANVTVVRSGRIRSIRWAIEMDTDADAELLRLELSTQASNQIQVNDSIGDIDAIRFYNNLTTSGVTAGELNIQRNIDFPVAANERIYLHGVVTGINAVVTVYIDVEER